MLVEASIGKMMAVPSQVALFIRTAPKIDSTGSGCLGHHFIHHLLSNMPCVSGSVGHSMMEDPLKLTTVPPGMINHMSIYRCAYMASTREHSCRSEGIAVDEGQQCVWQVHTDLPDAWRPKEMVGRSIIASKGFIQK